MLLGQKFKLIKKPNKEEEKRLREDIEREGGLDKTDMPAMLLSAYVVIFLPIIAVLLLILLFFWLF